MKALSSSPFRLITHCFILLLLGLSPVLAATDTVPRGTRLSIESSISLSSQVGTEDAAGFGRIMRLLDGTLIVVYRDAAGPAESAWDFDGNIYVANDIFMTYSKDDGATWSSPLNISNTANLTDNSVFYDPDGNGADGLGGLAPRNFYGDSDKATIFAPSLRDNIIVSWVDKYCGPGAHGPAVYTAPYLNLTPGEIEVPFSCVYAARLINSATDVQLLMTEQITDGSRDANGDVGRGSGAGFALTWQEDPLGLQPGEAEGPGEGGSGAKVSHGTDVWYTWITTANFVAGNPWATPVRVSDNDGGNTGASRPNLFVGSAPGTQSQAILAYEETKGLGFIEGKYVVYHVFPFNNPDVASSGTIISDPLENGRRVRFVAQGQPGTTEGTRLIIFWRQGVANEGGPADIMGRVGHVPTGTDLSTTPSAGWRPQDLTPAVVDSGDPVIALGNSPALNLSSLNLADAATDNPLDNARAHRAILEGDFIAVGYSYTLDEAVSRYTDLANYNFYIRRTSDGGQTWDTPRNISNITDTTLNVKEPRLVETPSGVSGTTNPSDVKNDKVFYIAWSTELNQYEAISQGSIDLEIFVTRTTDQGESYEPVQKVAATDLSQTIHNGESQLRTTPDGNTLFIVWRNDSTSGSEIEYASAVPVSTSSTSSSSRFAGLGGCSVNRSSGFDPTLPALVLLSLLFLSRQRWLKSSQENDRD